jgi:hypothetical protein
MALKVSKKIQGMSPRFFSKATLVVTILPLWALWVYAYATLKTLQSEVEALPQFYGMYLYKENARSRLEGAAARMTLFEVRGGEEIEGDRLEGHTKREWERFDLLFGLEEALIVVEREGLRILHPSEPPFGAAEFLGEPVGREAFLRTLQQMDADGLRGGYLSIDTRNAPDRSDKRCWFLTMAPVGEGLLSVLSVPEEQVRLSGEILEEAKENLLEQRRNRFVRLTLPVVVFSSLFIGILYRQSRPSNRGRGT